MEIGSVVNGATLVGILKGDEIEVFVWDNGRGSFNVSARDIESGIFFDEIRVGFPSRIHADAYANVWAS